jgi:hypothetical protein
MIEQSAASLVGVYTPMANMAEIAEDVLAMPRGRA